MSLPIATLFCWRDGAFSACHFWPMEKMCLSPGSPQWWGSESIIVWEESCFHQNFSYRKMHSFAVTLGPCRDEDNSFLPVSSFCFCFSPQGGKIPASVCACCCSILCRRSTNACRSPFPWSGLSGQARLYVNHPSWKVSFNSRGNMLVCALMEKRLFSNISKPRGPSSGNFLIFFFSYPFRKKVTQQHSRISNVAFGEVKEA